VEVNCHICDAVAEVTLTEGRLNILEVHSLKGQPLYDWTGGGSIKTNFCKDCFSGLAKQIYREGYYADHTLRRDEE
jgi:uncharacterized protein YlaI